MLLITSLAFVLAGAPSECATPSADGLSDTTFIAKVTGPADSLRAGELRVGQAAADTVPTLPADTVRPRVKAVELSDWYYRRLGSHQWGSYVMVPLFGLQYIAGRRLFNDPANAPTWAKTGHRVGATLLAGVFTVNTVTGAWNLWDNRSVPEHRLLRYAHALSMLGADAAFTYAGAKLSTEAQNSLEKRRLHRTVALSAIGVSAASALIMKLFNPQ